MLFTGTYEHTIDAKQRLAIPSDVRSRLNPEHDGESLFAVLGEGPTLCLYTERGFEKRAEQLDDSELPSDELLDYERMLFSLAARLEIDKQGRVRLPDHLLKLVNLERDVVLLGVKDHLEIHNRDQWMERMQAMLANRPELLMNPRRAIRGRSPG